MSRKDYQGMFAWQCDIILFMLIQALVLVILYALLSFAEVPFSSLLGNIDRALPWYIQKMIGASHSMRSYFPFWFIFAIFVFWGDAKVYMHLCILRGRYIAVLWAYSTTIVLLVVLAWYQFLVFYSLWWITVHK